MRRKQLLTGLVAAGLTAGVLGAPAAMAGNFGSIKVVPEKGANGASVAIEAFCSPAGLESAPVVSEAIHAADLKKNSEYGLATTGKVDTKIKPGTYEVSFTCWHVKVSTTFEVLPSETTTTPPPPPSSTTSKPRPTSKPKPPTTKPKAPQVVVKPKAAPETGGGGTAG